MLHGAISSLAAKCLRDRYWSERVKPQTEAELADASVQSLGTHAICFVHGQLLMPMTLTTEYAPESKFRAAVAMKEELLKNAVISYLGTASDFTETDFTLVISPSITTPKHEERPTRFIGELSWGGRIGVPMLTQKRWCAATVPTIGDAIETLDEFCRDLAHVLLRIVDISAELASKDHIRVDNIEEVRIRCTSIQCNVASRHMLYRSCISRTPHCSRTSTCGNARILSAASSRSGAPVQSDVHRPSSVSLDPL